MRDSFGKTNVLTPYENLAKNWAKNCGQPVKPLQKDNVTTYMTQVKIPGTEIFADLALRSVEEIDEKKEWDFEC